MFVIVEFLFAPPTTMTSLIWLFLILDESLNFRY